MYVARLIMVSILILGIVFTYSPLVREEASQFWEHVRPAVIVIMMTFMPPFAISSPVLAQTMASKTTLPVWTLIGLLQWFLGVLAEVRVTRISHCVRMGSH